MNNWDILKKELSIYGIKIRDTRPGLSKNTWVCEVLHNGKYVPVKTKSYINILKKRIGKNRELLEEVWKDTSTYILSGLSSLNRPISEKSSVPQVDERHIRLFVHSIKDIVNSYFEIKRDMGCPQEIIEKENTYIIFKKLLNSDYKTFSTEFINAIPEFNISINWIIRKVSVLSYIIKLLKFSMQKSKFIDTFNIKMAKGIEGPWGNMDLPIRERRWEWSDTEDEILGRQRDITKQRRYRMGLENYHDPGVGEGFYWREQRNEPFSWDKRYEDSPYSPMGRGVWR